MNKNNSLLIELFKSLENTNINYCILRNYNNLPYNTNGSDLDIWVAQKDISHFISILELTSKNTNCELVSYVKNKLCPKYCFQNEKDGLQIDIFPGNIYFQNSIIVDENSIINNIILYNKIKVLENNFANIISLIKEIIYNSKCDDKYTFPIYNNIELYNKEYLRQSLHLFNEKFISLLYESITNNKLKINAHKLCILGRKSVVQKTNLFFYNLKKLNRFFSLSPGYVLCILGTDGSGKSTIIKNITPLLNEGFHNGIIYNHLRPNTIPDISVIIGKRKESSNKTVVSNPHDVKQSGLIGSLIRWSYYMIDYTLGYLKVVYPIIHSKSKIFIFDRYYYDYYIDPKRSKINLPHFILKFGELFIPKPDIILCLGGDPEKIYNRKPETSLEEVKRQTKELKKFCKKHNNAVWIDTCTDIETSTNESMIAICNMMKKRFSKFKFK